MKYNWKRIKEIADRNALFLESVPDDFIDYDVDMSEEELVNLLWLLIDDFETEDGKIKKSRKNFILIGDIDSVFKKFSNAAGLLLIMNLISKLQKVVSNNFSYYAQILDSKSQLFKTVKDSIINLVNRRIGLDADGTPKKDGYIDDLLKISSIKNQTKELVFRTVLGEPTPAELKRTVKLFISGDKEKETRGEIAKFYSRFTGETFSQLDRMAASQFGISFNLTEFIYYGTLIKTSRAFCRKKIHGIYTIEEGKLWPYENPKPLGISNATYDPVIDMGGVNCRHIAYFLTRQMAEEMKASGSKGFNL